MKPELIELGKRIQSLRTNRKWSREELAVLCSFHVTYIGQVERGEKNISFENLLKFSRAFGITASALLAGLENGTSGHRANDQARRRTGVYEGASRESVFRLRALVKQLIAQKAVIDRTISTLASALSAEPPSGPRLQKKPRRRPKI